MKRRYLISIVGAFTVLLALVTAGCYHRTPEQRADHVVRHLAATLKLDAAQTAKLEKMKDDFLAERPALQKMREESFADLREMMLSGQIDEQRLNARMEKVQTHANDMIRLVFAKFTELHDMLTPEQRKLLAKEMEKHAERHHHW